MRFTLVNNKHDYDCIKTSILPLCAHKTRHDGRTLKLIHLQISLLILHADLSAYCKPARNATLITS